VNFVIDASVAIKWFVEENLTDAALRLLERPEPFHAPEFIVVEMANIAWKKVVRGEIGHEQAGDIVNSVQSGDLEFYSTNALNSRALEIALDLRHPVYDCLYIACAEAVGEGWVVTADGRLGASVADTPYAGLVAHISDIVG
jgi:predicted nucleic acid-binding protein